MRLGLVSNVWNVQLARGEDLGDLVGAAAQRGYRVIELRQKSLGRYESPDTALPDVSALGALAAEFPSLHFVAAYEVPFLDPDTTPDERYFRRRYGGGTRGCQRPPAARAFGGPAHLSGATRWLG